VVEASATSESGGQTVSQEHGTVVRKDRELYTCNVKQIPTSWAFNNPPGIIEQHDVVFTDVGRAWPTFHFRNSRARPIEALAIVIEYKDKEDHTISEVPFGAATKHAASDYQLPFPVCIRLPIRGSAHFPA